MSFTKIWIHLVWATKKREQILLKPIRQKLFPHIWENGREKNIHIDFVNGHIDHVHVLLSLKADQSISRVTQMIKGESSYWMNKNNLTTAQFEWQDDYFAVSVSESKVSIVRDYIRNQEKHHETKTFQEEHDEFMARYGFVMMQG